MQYIYGTDTVQQGFNKINENFLNVPSGTTEEILQQAQEQAEEYTNSVISNPNILLNSNFADPVNQKGQTTYTGGITIDMWQFSATNATLSLQNGYIEINNMSDNSTANVYQTLEEIYAGQTLTISLNAKGNFNILALNQSGEFSRKALSASEFTTFTNTYTVPDNSTSLKIYININPNNTADISWIKLEKGSIATDYQIPNKTLETLKCQRYMYILQPDISFLASTGGTATQGYMAIPQAVEMRISPTLSSNTGINIRGNGKGNTAVTSFTVYKKSTNCVTLSLTIPEGFAANQVYWCYTTQQIILDANIY